MIPWFFNLLLFSQLPGAHTCLTRGFHWPIFLLNDCKFFYACCSILLCMRIKVHAFLVFLRAIYFSCNTHNVYKCNRCNASFHFCKSVHCIGCIFKNDDIVTAVLLRPCIAPLHFYRCETMLRISLAFFQIWLHCYNFFLFANRYILCACFTVD